MKSNATSPQANFGQYQRKIRSCANGERRAKARGCIAVSRVSMVVRMMMIHCYVAPPSTTGFALAARPSFVTFLDEEPYNGERSHGVYPPLSGEKLNEQPDHDNNREPTARDTFNCIGTHRAAPEPLCENELSFGEDVHYWDRSKGDCKTDQRELRALTRPKAPCRACDDVEREGK